MQTIFKDTTTLADGGLNFLLSSPFEIDAYNDIVGDPDHPEYGWDLSVHVKNPACFYGHDTSIPPIARWKNVGVRDRALRGTLVFPPRGVSRFADEISDLTTAGIVRGCSVGFRPTKSKPLASGGTHWLRQTLVEVSLCGIPALPSALLDAKQLGISSETIQRVFKNMNNPPSVGERIRKARANVRKARAMLGKMTDPISRATLMKAIAILEDMDREQTARYSGVQHAASSAEQKRQQEAAAKAAAVRTVDAMMKNYKPSEEAIASRYAVPKSPHPSIKPVLTFGGREIYRRKNRFGW
ncbi:MAG: hypothetical protein ACXVOI_09510 [Tumebacillaceae bacterium]